MGVKFAYPIRSMHFTTSDKRQPLDLFHGPDPHFAPDGPPFLRIPMSQLSFMGKNSFNILGVKWQKGRSTQAHLQVGHLTQKTCSQITKLCKTFN